MIIGHGNISQAITDRPDVTFWCSGVSNSAETRESEFKREIDALINYKRTNKINHLVYFSSLSIYRSDSPYNKHKRLMEDVVRYLHIPYTIIRVEVIEWGRNPTTIHNVFRRLLSEGIEPEVQDTFRYVVSKEEFQYWLGLIPVGEKTEMNIPGVRYSIKEILNMVKEEEL